MTGAEEEEAAGASAPSATPEVPGVNKHPGEREQRRWESDYLLGIKRVRRLYCNVGIGFHLQVRPDGSVNGVHRENLHSLIEISTVDRGVVSLFGVQSRRFVAMNRRGRLYGTTFGLRLVYGTAFCG
ncbi:unnamed protein product [Boreogadus saida]